MPVGEVHRDAQPVVAGQIVDRDGHAGVAPARRHDRVGPERLVGLEPVGARVDVGGAVEVVALGPRDGPEGDHHVVAGPDGGGITRRRGGVLDDGGRQDHVTPGVEHEGLIQQQVPAGDPRHEHVLGPERVTGGHHGHTPFEGLGGLVDVADPAGLEQLDGRVVDGSVRHVVETDPHPVRVVLGELVLGVDDHLQCRSGPHLQGRGGIDLSPQVHGHGERIEQTGVGHGGEVLALHVAPHDPGDLLGVAAGDVGHRLGERLHRGRGRQAETGRQFQGG